MGCEGGCIPNLDFTNDVDVAQGTRAELVEEGGVELWLVKQDNPVVGGLFQVPYGNVNGSAQRGSLSNGDWRYDQFDLNAVWGDFNQNVGDTFPTWPQYPGSYVLGDSFFWEAHGVRLQPRVTGAPLEAPSVVIASANFYDGNGFQPHEGPGLFELDPVVKVVPVVVVVLYPMEGHPDFPAGWVSEQDAELLFDDRWRATKQQGNNQVTGTWTHRPGCDGLPGCQTDVGNTTGPGVGLGAAQPDLIFTECNIQFRLVGYHQCAVSEDTFFNDSCNITGKTNSWAAAAGNACGIQASALQVVFGGQLVDPQGGCTGETLGAYNSNLGGYVFIGAQGYRDYRYVVAHEIGHRLGLDHVSSSMFPNTLMLAQAANMGPSLLATENDVPQCDIAYTQASTIHNGYW